MVYLFKSVPYEGITSNRQLEGAGVHSLEQKSGQQLLDQYLALDEKQLMGHKHFSIYASECAMSLVAYPTACIDKDML